MTHTTTAPTQLRSGNPALSQKLIATELMPLARRSMSVAGVSAKTFVLLVFLVAGGSWGWSSATQSIPADIGSG